MGRILLTQAGQPGIIENKNTQTMNYGMKMRQWRINHDLSQKAMGEKLGLGQQVYSYYERGLGDPKLDLIKRFKELTGINLTDPEEGGNKNQPRNEPPRDDMPSPGLIRMSLEVKMEKLIKEHNLVVEIIEDFRIRINEMEQQIKEIKKNMVASEERIKDAQKKSEERINEIYKKIAESEERMRVIDKKISNLPKGRSLARSKN